MNNSQWLFSVVLYFLLMMKVKVSYLGKNPETRTSSYKELFNLCCCSLFCLVPDGPQAALIEPFSLCLRKLSCVQFQWMGYLIGVRNRKGSGGIIPVLIFSELGNQRSLRKAGQRGSNPSALQAFWELVRDASSLTPRTINVSLCLFWTLMFIAYQKPLIQV